MKKLTLHSLLCFSIVFTSANLQSAYALNAAIVNGQAIPLELLDFVEQEEKKQTQKNTQTLVGKEKTSFEMTDSRKKIREGLIQTYTLAHEAQARGIEKNIEYQFELYKLERTLAIQVLQQKIIEDIKSTFSKKIKEEVDQKLKYSKEYLVKHILVKEESQAQQVISELNKGVIFDNLVAQSVEPNAAARKGSLGWSRPEMFVPEFATALKNLPAGTYTKTPIKTQFGYHIIFLEQTRPIAQEILENEVATKVIEREAPLKFAVLRDAITKNSASNANNIPPHILVQFEKLANPNKDAKTTAFIKEEVSKVESFYQEAKKQGILVQDNYRFPLLLKAKKMQIEMLARQIKEQHLKDIKEITIQQAYEQHVEQLKKQPPINEYKVRHILLNSESDAQQIVALLDKGENFTELAKKSQDTVSATNGGDLGWMQKEIYGVEFSKALETLSKGKYTPKPFKTDFGWHILYLYDIHTKPFVAPVYNVFKQQKQQHLANEFFVKFSKNLFDKARIQ